MTYRLRRQLAKWVVLIYDEGGKYIGGYGPFDTIEQADERAAATGYRDGDK